MHESARIAIRYNHRRRGFTGTCHRHLFEAAPAVELNALRQRFDAVDGELRAGMTRWLERRYGSANLPTDDLIQQAIGGLWEYHRARLEELSRVEEDRLDALLKRQAYVILRRRVADYFRAMRPEASLDDVQLNAGDSPLLALESRQRVERLVRMFAELSAPERDLLALVADDRAHGELQLGPRDRKRLSRLRRRLLERLKE